ncbi:MAG: rhomboid family intramembrane serine protease, partial [Acidimicrobiia bacterium]
MSIVRPHLDALTAPGAPFEVVTEMVAGHPVRTYAARQHNLRSFITAGEAHGAREFLVQGERRVTFGDAFHTARSVAAGLAARFGVGAGDRVAVVGANSVDWVVAYWGAVALNAVAVPLNAWWRPSELAFGIADSGTQVAFTDTRRGRALIEAGFPPQQIVTWGDGPAGTVPLRELATWEPLDLAAAPATDENHPAVIFYTSGTTGRPKGSANTHHNIIANFLNAVVFLLDNILFNSNRGNWLAPWGWGSFSVTKAIGSLQLWRFVTYQFIHANFFHVFFNMLAVYFFGPIMERWWGSRRFLIFY